MCGHGLNPRCSATSKNPHLRYSPNTCGTTFAHGPWQRPHTRGTTCICSIDPTCGSNATPTALTQHLWHDRQLLRRIPPVAVTPHVWHSPNTCGTTGNCCAESHLWHGGPGTQQHAPPVLARHGGGKVEVAVGHQALGHSPAARGALHAPEKQMWAKCVGETSVTTMPGKQAGICMRMQVESATSWGGKSACSADHAYTGRHHCQAHAVQTTRTQHTITARIL